jgi:hypothetical protein
MMIFRKLINKRFSMIFINALLAIRCFAFLDHRAKVFLVGAHLSEPTTSPDVIYRLLTRNDKKAWPHTTSIAVVLKVFCFCLGFQ